MENVKPSTWTTPKRVGVALVTAVGIAVGVGGAALASGSPSPSPSERSPGDQGSQSAPAKPLPEGKLRGFGGFGHHGFGLLGGPGFALHGEFVVPKRDGGYQTIATQQGSVTEVSSSSITVKSEDGYTKTYKVTENTLVNAARDGIDTVKKGHDVMLTATVADGTATVVELHDVTVGRAARERWAPVPQPVPLPDKRRTSPGADSSGSVSLGGILGA
jgi:hypothetical protein